MFRQPSRGSVSAAAGRINPYATTTIRSGDQSSSALRPSGVRRVAGCAIGSARSAASSLTGEARSSRPRPAGRSGWVSTPTTWWRDSSSARSAGSAKCGVPANAIRNELIGAVDGFSVGARAGLLACPAGAFLAVLFELLANAFALQVGEIVDEQLAFEMIHLVLQTDGSQSV